MVHILRSTQQEYQTDAMFNSEPPQNDRPGIYRSDSLPGYVQYPSIDSISLPPNILEDSSGFREYYSLNQSVEPHYIGTEDLASHGVPGDLEWLAGQMNQFGPQAHSQELKEISSRFAATEPGVEYDESAAKRDDTPPERGVASRAGQKPRPNRKGQSNASNGKSNKVNKSGSKRKTPEQIAKDKRKEAILAKFVAQNIPLSQLVTEYPGVLIEDMNVHTRRSTQQRHAEFLEQTVARVKRPCNSFLLYRKAYLPLALAWSGEGCNQLASKVVGASWKEELPHVRHFFAQKGVIEAANHMKAFPGYKFEPKKDVGKKGKNEALEADENGSSSRNRAKKTPRTRQNKRQKSTASPAMERDTCRNDTAVYDSNYSAEYSSRPSIHTLQGEQVEKPYYRDPEPNLSASVTTIQSTGLPATPELDRGVPNYDSSSYLCSELAPSGDLGQEMSELQMIDPHLNLQDIQGNPSFELSGDAYPYGPAEGLDCLDQYEVEQSSFFEDALIAGEYGFS